MRTDRSRQVTRRAKAGYLDVVGTRVLAGAVELPIGELVIVALLVLVPMFLVMLLLVALCALVLRGATPKSRYGKLRPSSVTLPARDVARPLPGARPADEAGPPAP